MCSPLAVFQTIQQPAVVKGNWTGAGFSLLEIVTALTLAYYIHQKKRRAGPELEDESGAAGSHEIDHITSTPDDSEGESATKKEVASITVQQKL